MLPGNALRIEGWAPLSVPDSAFGFSFEGGQLLTTVLNDFDQRYDGNTTYELCEPTVTETDFAAINTLGADVFELSFLFQSVQGVPHQFAGVPNSNFYP